MSDDQKNHEAPANQSIEVHDLPPEEDPRGGVTVQTVRPVKWELSELDAVVNNKPR